MNILIHKVYKTILTTCLLVLTCWSLKAMDNLPAQGQQETQPKYLIVQNNFAQEAKNALDKQEKNIIIPISQDVFNQSTMLKSLVTDMQTSTEQIKVAIPFNVPASKSTIQTGFELLFLYEKNNMAELHNRLKNTSIKSLIDLANIFSYLDVPKNANQSVINMLGSKMTSTNPTQAIATLAKFNPDLKKEFFTHQIIQYLKDRAIEKNGQNIHHQYLKNENDQTGFFTTLIAKFSPDGNYIASDDINGIGSCVTLWDMKNKGTARTVAYHGYSVQSPNFSPDSKYISAIAREDNPIIILCNIETGKIEHELSHSNDPVSALFSPDGTKIIAAYKGNSQNLILWDVKSGKILKILDAHENDVTSAMFSPDGKYIISTSEGEKNNLILWNAQICEKIASLDGHKKGVIEALFSPNGQYLISIPKPTAKATRIPGSGLISTISEMSDNGGLIIWNMKDLSVIQKLDAQYLTNTYFSPDSTKVAIKIDDGTSNLFLLDITNLNWIGVERAVNSIGIGIGDIPFSPDSNLIVSKDLIKKSPDSYLHDSHLTLQSAITGKIIQSYPLAGNVLYSIFSPDGTQITSIPLGSQDSANLIVSSILHLEQRLFLKHLQNTTDEKSNLIKELLYKLSLAQKQNIALNLTESEWKTVESLPATIKNLLDLNSIQLTQETKQLYITPTPYVIPPQTPAGRVQRLREYLASWLSYFKKTPWLSYFKK